MRLRLLILLLLAGLPLASYADSSNLTPSDGSAAGLSAPANASSLGPAANTGNAGGSSADSGTLQPAGTSPLQSTTNDSNGLSAPSSNNPLQAPATGNTQLQVVMGDGDGPTHNVAGTSTDPWTILWWSLGIGALIVGVSLVWRRRRHRRASAVAGPDEDSRSTGPQPDWAGDTEPTSSQRLRITIGRPAAEVFDFVLDPKNTPTWISFIQSETTTEWPPRLGTVYTNTDETDTEREFKLTEFKPAESFVLSKLSNTYHVRYTVTELEHGLSELEYYEWMDEGNLAQPFTSAELEVLKAVLEKTDASGNDPLPAAD